MNLKTPKFTNESEEADWWYANRKVVERELRKAEKSGKGKKAADIIAEHIAAQKKTQPITIRLTKADVALAKAQAVEKGLPYQTYLKSVLHQALTQLAAAAK